MQSLCNEMVVSLSCIKVTKDEMEAPLRDMEMLSESFNLFSSYLLTIPVLLFSRDIVSYRATFTHTSFFTWQVLLSESLTLRLQLYSVFSWKLSWCFASNYPSPRWKDFFLYSQNIPYVNLRLFPEHGGLEVFRGGTTPTLPDTTLACNQC